MTALKSMFYVLTLSYILVMFVNPSLGISVSYGADGASSSSNYHLDTSTTLNDVGTLGDGTIYRTSQVSGSGDNEYSYQTSAKGSSAESAVKSSGVLSATTSTIASGEVAVLSQGVAGIGDLSAAISGSSGSVAADQQAGVENGVLSTSQSLATTGNVAVAGQKTQIIGDVGSISSSAFGQENFMGVAGDGAINGAVNADLQAVASTRSFVTGSISDKDSEILGERDLQDVASDENIGLSTSNLYYGNDLGIKSFDANAVNLKGSLAVAASPYIPPNHDWPSDAYAFTVYMWANKDGYNPKIPLYINNKNIGNGINGNDFANAIKNAAKTWDDACPKQLFDFNNFGYGYTGSTHTFNGKNEVGWSPNLGTSTLASTKAWNRAGTNIVSSSGRYSPSQWVTESDIMFNANWAFTWTAQPRSSGSKPYDAQAVGVHELGHLLGLHHISSDKKEIMWPYYPFTTGRSLGTGDKLGINKLYS